MKNYLKYSLGLVFAVVVILFGLHYLPSITICGHSMKRVDLLSDLRPKEEIVDTNTTAPLKEKLPFVNTCPEGMTCIEDYGDSSGFGMDHFYHALDRFSSNKKSDCLVRIAVFGDSFIEGDIMTGDLREMLQKHYGGCGVGIVPITSETNGFRRTVRHSFSGWNTRSVTDTSYFDKEKLGISGHYFIPHNGAYVELRGQSKYASLLDTCERASIFLESKGRINLSTSINRKEDVSFLVEHSDLSEVPIEGRIGSIRWKINWTDSTTLVYGVAMDGKCGIILDNFSLRGSSGLQLREIPEKKLKQFNDLRPYDLIILEYGLNIATKRGNNYDNYKKNMLTVIKHLKECFPQASILLLSAPDRTYKVNNEFHTMPGVKNLVLYQQDLAEEAGIAFWNMYEAMGGDGSMANLVHANPPMANKDYTHINFQGGKYIAGLLYDVLLYGKEQYDKKRIYEKE